MVYIGLSRFAMGMKLINWIDDGRWPHELYRAHPKGPRPAAFLINDVHSSV